MFIHLCNMIVYSIIAADNEAVISLLKKKKKGKNYCISLAEYVKFFNVNNRGIHLKTLK